MRNVKVREAYPSKYKDENFVYNVYQKKMRFLFQNPTMNFSYFEHASLSASKLVLQNTSSAGKSMRAKQVDLPKVFRSLS